MSNPGSEKQGVLAGAQRVLALDFGRRVTGPRVRPLQQAPGAIGSELTRARNMLGLDGSHPLPRMVGGEAQRTKLLSDRALGMLGAEAKRRPHPIEGVVPSSFEFSRNTANNLDTGMRFFGLGRRFMPDLSDLEHRTEHRDDRPEATIWQRLRRRLPIF